VGASVGGMTAHSSRAEIFSVSPFPHLFNVSSNAILHRLPQLAVQEAAPVTHRVAGTVRGRFGGVHVAWSVGSSAPPLAGNFVGEATKSPIHERSYDEAKYGHVRGALHRPSGAFLWLHRVASG
jgi:hypothetical protein